MPATTSSTGDDVTGRHQAATLSPERAPAPAAPADGGRRRARVRRTAAERRRLGLLVTAEVVLTACVLAVLYLGWYLVVDDRAAAADQTSAAAELERAWDDAPATGPAAAAPAAGPADLTAGEPFAVLRVPRFGDDWRRPVVEGTSRAELDRGVGHYAGTALPGQVGNFSVAGHRLTHGSAFTRIAELRVGDVVGVRTASTWYVYRVTGSTIVEPRQLEVIAPVPDAPGVVPTDAVMTLTSCHPLFGSSERYVVHAALVTTQPAADGVPAALREEVA